jgi:hypothetical protein
MVLIANMSQAAAGFTAEPAATFVDEMPSELSANGQSSFADRIDFHASLSQGYLISNRNNWVAETEAGTLAFNEFAANVSYDISDNLRVGFQLISRDFGPLMNNKVILDWAMVDYRWRDALGVRLGRLRTPFGLYNANRDVDSARISILLPGGVYPERGRDQVENLDGGALYGVYGLGDAGTMEYFMGYGKKIMDTEGGTAHYLQANDNILDSGSISNIDAEGFFSFQLSYDTPWMVCG